MAKYCVFLDIDGVLCSHRVQIPFADKHGMWDRFDPVAVDFFNMMDAKYDIDWVLMSTWKNHLKADDPMIFHWMNAAFRSAGFRGTYPYPNWKTNPRNELDRYNKMNGRAHEVKDYLSEFGPYDDFMLFDDSHYDFNQVLGVKRWVRCDPNDGILTKQMQHAMSLMGNWEKK